MRNKIKYSQNFLKNANLIQQLLDKTDIDQEDTILEIGAGNGIITQELIKRTKKIIAYEIDRELYLNLKNKFKNTDRYPLK